MVNIVWVKDKPEIWGSTTFSLVNVPVIAVSHDWLSHKWNARPRECGQLLKSQLNVWNWYEADWWSVSTLYLSDCFIPVRFSPFNTYIHTPCFLENWIMYTHKHHSLSIKRLPYLKVTNTRDAQKHLGFEKIV